GCVGELTYVADVRMRLAALELLLAHSPPPVLLLGFGVDGLAGDRLRHFLVAIELHGERGPALRRRAQVGCVAKDGCEADARPNCLRVAPRLEVLDVTAA